MKAKLEQLPLGSADSSFVYYHLIVPSFDFVWHYHPEYELTLILKSKGKRFVGDSYENYEAGDLVLLGPMLPHSWVSGANMNDNCEAIVIQFSQIFIDPLFGYPEMKEVRTLLANAKNGLHFQAVTNDMILLLRDLVKYKGMDAFLLLIKVLHMLTGKKAKQLSSGYLKPLNDKAHHRRIAKVFAYVQANYTTKVSLSKASELVHLSESAFCKFFKRVTGKTFSDYVNEIRISKACELIMETDKPIELVAFETGFESQTYFNRVFLKKKAVSPKKYRDAEKAQGL
ncbi:AraC family transcriptional regulator [Mucilaginibacter psychrotolerans]|uniref:AraC family transcriptional regulator n=1 Tax=Mucilaginibacter psychrotolerans TaxID=1524096 RepID=A0A4Y8SET0_9SPHI|nr:AraC family transcriptional regulator [Mucilaginibacter psychrotolerans]TFF37130.1 AraC family transcriptional regulator [Mucilaginibacter psychrotolerans]